VHRQVSIIDIDRSIASPCLPPSAPKPIQNPSANSRISLDGDFLRDDLRMQTRTPSEKYQKK
jgi:hypothetical protein